MASTFDNDLRLEEMATGENAGSWGTKTNTNLELIADAFGYGTFTIADADTTLTMPDGSDTDNALRSLYLKISSSADLTTTRTLTLAPNTVSKLWYIENNTSGGQTITISQGSGANISILNGQAKLIATDGAGAGAAVIDVTQDLAIPDLFIDDDLSLQSDGAIINFGADAEIQLTHVADTGLLLTETGGGAPTLQIRDSALSISSSTDGQLDIDADTEIEIVAPTVDIDASTEVNISGDLKVDTDTLYVDSANNKVAVGTTSTSKKLTVQTSTTYDGVQISNAHSSSAARLQLDNDNSKSIQIDVGGSTSSAYGPYDADTASVVANSAPLNIGTDSANHIGFYTNLTERMRVESDGDVGIGTSTSLSRKLTVSDDVNPAGYTIDLRTSGAYNSGYQSGMVFSAPYDSGGAITDLASIQGGKENTTDGNYGGRVTFHTRVNGGSDTEHMRITSTGLVGIGTTEPTGKLSVSDPTYLSNSATLGSSITLNSENTSSWLGTRELISFESVGNGADHRTGTLSIKLKTGSSDTTLTEYMQINAVSNYFTFTPNGNERMRINNNTTTLTTNSAEFYTTGMQINSTNSDFSGAIMDVRATSGSINTANGRFLRFYSDNGSTERFHVKGSGEIYSASGGMLLGTTTHSVYYNSVNTYNASMVLKTSTANEITDFVITNGNNDFGSAVEFARTNTNSQDVRFASIVGIPTSTTAGSEAGDIVFKNKSTTTSNISETMRIKSSGDIEMTTSNSGVGLYINNTTHDSIVQIQASGANKNSTLRFADGDDSDVGQIDYDHNTNRMNIRAAAQNIGAFDSDGLRLESGKGIKFDPFGSGNILDDYEEGTFTPSFIGAGQNPTITYSTATGIYTKVGRVVHASIMLSWTGKSGGSGQLRLGGLPFASNGATRGVASIAYNDNGLIGSNGSILLHTNASSSAIYFMVPDSQFQSTTYLQADTGITTGAGYFQIAMTYQTS